MSQGNQDISITYQLHNLYFKPINLYGTQPDVEQVHPVGKVHHRIHTEASCHPKVPPGQPHQ